MILLNVVDYGDFIFLYSTLEHVIVNAKLIET